MSARYDDYNYYPPLSDVKCQPLDEEGRTRFERMVDEQIEKDEEIGEAALPLTIEPKSKWQRFVDAWR